MAGEFDNRRADGSTYVEFVKVAPVRTQGGHITHFVAFKEDITEKKRIGAELDMHRHHLQELVAQRTRELEEANAVIERRAEEVATSTPRCANGPRRPRRPPGPRVPSWPI